MKYSLVGVDGNAFAIMGYTARALKNEGLYGMVDPMYAEAKSDDYDNVIRTCMKYLDSANLKAEVNSWNLEDDEEE